MSLNKDYEKMNFSDGRTKQEFKDDVDINRIIEKWLKTGHAPAFLEAPGQKQSADVDISGAVDFHTAMGMVARTQQIFSSFNARIRDRFNNDPEEFLRFMENPKNAEEAIKLGIAKPRPVPAGPMKVEVVNPSPAPGKDDKKP